VVDGLSSKRIIEPTGGIVQQFQKQPGKTKGFPGFIGNPGKPFPFLKAE
jgi:hypothetical protein